MKGLPSNRLPCRRWCWRDMGTLIFVRSLDRRDQMHRQAYRIDISIERFPKYRY